RNPRDEGAVADRELPLRHEQLEALALLDGTQLGLGRILRRPQPRPGGVTVAVAPVDAPVAELDAAGLEGQAPDPRGDIRLSRVDRVPVVRVPQPEHGDPIPTLELGQRVDLLEHSLAGVD